MGSFLGIYFLSWDIGLMKMEDYKKVKGPEVQRTTGGVIL